MNPLQEIKNQDLHERNTVRQDQQDSSKHIHEKFLDQTRGPSEKSKRHKMSNCPLVSRLNADGLQQVSKTSDASKWQPHRIGRRMMRATTVLGQLKMSVAAKMILTTTCCLLVLATMSHPRPVAGQLQEGSPLIPQPQAGDSPAASQSLQQPLLLGTGSLMNVQQQPQQARGPRQIDISVQPNTLVRIECRLPPLAMTQMNRTRTFYWNFQRTSVQEQKPDLLCYGGDCINAAQYNVELDFDQASGTYDLIIANATYELNDGIYYCDYRDTSPETRQTINREFRLTVLLAPQAPTISASSAAPAREGQEYQLNCQSVGGNPEPNITWFKNDLQLTPGQANRIEQVRQNGTTTSVLTWIPTADDNQAIYKCEVTNKAMAGLAPFVRDVTLPVEYAPRISVGPFNPMRVMQGERTTISCQVDANPPVKSIRWLRDGHQLVSNQYNHTIHEAKISDAAVYSCQADNGIAPAAVLLGGASGTPTGTLVNQASPSGGVFSLLGLSSAFSSSNNNNPESSKTLVEARLHLEVLYAPRVQVRESRSQPLNEGDYLTLNCSAESWPPAYEFVWTKQEDVNTYRRLTSSSPTLEFAALSASDMGNYTCTAFNRLEPSSSGISGGGGSGSGSQVFERQGSASHMVLVRHKPGLAELSLGQNGETELGNKTQIKCRAKPPGYPEPKYSFWKWQQSVSGTKNNKLFLNKNSVSQDSTYTIFSARPDDEGKYGCMASNTYGSSNEAVGDLVVNEAPTIVADKTWRSEDARQPGYYPYSITVRATGKPEPRVSWFHRSPVDGRRIDLSSPEMQARFRIETQSKPEPQSLRGSGGNNGGQGGELGAQSRPKYIVLSTLTFKAPLEIDDRGLYTVEFSNGLSRVAVESHKLHINHGPIPAIKNMPIVAPSSQPSPTKSDTTSPSAVMTRTRAGFNLGETVNLTCRVSAYPEPTFVWHSQSSGASGLDRALENDRRYRTSVVNYQDDIWESTMSFELTSEADYGDYMCVTANQDLQTQMIGDSVRILIHLGRKSLPEPPVQVDQIDATQDSVTLQWIAGFDGGFAQNQFTVQYAPDDQSGMSLMRRFGPLVNEQQQALASTGNQLDLANGPDQQAYPRLYDCLSMNPCTINNLQPRQAYLMRIRARNELGFSDFSDDFRVSTRANITHMPSIQEAYFDSTKNILRFRVEPNPEYLLNNLEARIEVRGGGGTSPSTTATNGGNSVDQASGGYQAGQQTTEEASGEWRRYPSVPIRHERGEAYLNMQPDSEQLRLTLCSRLNESLCGPEYILSTREGVASSFLRDQQGLSISIVASSLILILVLGGFATTTLSCCLSRKAKKAAGLDHVDSNGRLASENKPLSGHVNGGLSLANGNSNGNVPGAKVGSHGSTTSTNSTSAGLGQLQSMDSINNNHLNGNHQNNLNGGSSSDHSSDHSRQAKLDSMVPPNYSHYADRASLMLEQQQQQQQAAYLQDKLASPFGHHLTNGSLHPQMVEPQIGDYFASYDPTSSAVMSSLEQQHPLDANQAAANSMMLNSVLNNPAGHVYDPSMMSNEASLYSTHQQMVDEYNNYNSALAYANQQQQQHEQMMESAYGTTGAPPSQVMAQPTQASYDNNANQSYSNYNSPYDQQQQVDVNSSQYQQDLAAAQQQMYGTLTRNSASASQGNGYLSDGNQNNNNNNTSNSSPSQQQQQQQQDQYITGGAGLMPPPPPPPQESDYGTTGARSGRLIREIIV